MKGYDKVLAITFLRKDKDGEMMASHEALKKKYAGRPQMVHCAVAVGEVSTVKDLTWYMRAMLESTQLWTPDDGGAPPEPTTTLGIYIGTHGNLDNTEIPPEIFGQAIATLAIEDGFRLRKVCIDSCLAAGKDYPLPAEDNSVAMRAAKCISGFYLALECTKWLAGCKIAGYRDIVMKYDKDAAFFREKEHIESKEKNLARRDIQTIFANGRYETARPKFEHAKGFMPADVRKTKGQNVLNYEKGDQIDVKNIIPNSPLALYIEKLNRYLALKKAWLFTDNFQWREIPLSQYSDNGMFAKFTLVPGPGQKGFVVSSVLNDVFVDGA